MKVVDGVLKLISILDFSLVFHAITFRTKYFYGNRKVIIHAYVALRPLVLLFGCLVAWGGRIVVTDRQIDRHTQTKYCYPRCACAPRVKEIKAQKCKASTHI